MSANTKGMQTALPQDISERIALLRFPLIVGVVFIHAYDPVLGKSLVLHYSKPVTAVCRFFSVGMASAAVPLFFLFAGYLFCWSLPDAWQEKGPKILRRMRALFVPLIFWNLVCLSVVALAQALPFASHYVAGRSVPVASYNLLQYTNAIIGLTAHPIAYQFWFVRDLLLLSALLPLLSALFSKFPALFFLGTGLWWAAAAPWTLPVVSREALLFFCAGSYLGAKHFDISRVDRLLPWCAVAYVPLVALDALYVDNMIHKLTELAGVVCVLCAAGAARRRPAMMRKLIALSSASFFVFAVHEPLLTIVRHASFKVVAPSSDGVILALYFLEPTLVIAFCVGLYHLGNNAMPQWMRFVTGGRALPIRVTAS